VAVLVGDNERDRAANELQRHYREGRLTTEELAHRLEKALRARNGSQLGSALKDLPGRWASSPTLQSPRRVMRNAAILVGTAVVWLFWSIGMLVAFVAWMVANGPSLAALLVFPLVWALLSWLLWTGSSRHRSR
jgi:Flp pilus assembly protein TadB